MRVVGHANFLVVQIQNPPSKHHYIPAFYLKRWEGQQDQKLTQFTKPFGTKLQTKRLKADRTGFDEGLYTLEGYEPELAQQVETNFLAPIDHGASIALGLLERFGHRAPWDSDSRSAWTRFLLSLLVRCPEDIHALREWYRNEVFGNPGPLAEAQYSRARSTDDYQTFAEFLRNQPITMKERDQFQALYALIDNAAIGTEINQMEWRVLETPDAAPSLLTSDRPVIRSASISSAGAHIALPIGPRLLFIATPHLDVLASIEKADQIKLVKDINLHVVRAASRFVYGGDDSQSRFIKNHFGSVPQPRIIENFPIRLSDIPSDKSHAQKV